MRIQGYYDVYKWTILRRTSPEVKCLHSTSSKREISMSSVSNVIYHKFSHGTAFYMLHRKNVNVMLEMPFHLELLDALLYLRAKLFYFRKNMVIVLGIPMFRTFTIFHLFQMFSSHSDRL